MSQDTTQSLITILVIAAGTFLTRGLSFVLFPASRPTPKWVTYLGTVLPYACIGMLVVYCLKSVELTALHGWLPELISIVAVVLLHLWRRSVLLSVGVGTVLYMLLVQLVFV